MPDDYCKQTVGSGKKLGKPKVQKRISRQNN